MQSSPHICLPYGTTNPVLEGSGPVPPYLQALSGQYCLCICRHKICTNFNYINNLMSRPDTLQSLFCFMSLGLIKQWFKGFWETGNSGLQVPSVHCDMISERSISHLGISDSTREVCEVSMCLPRLCSVITATNLMPQAFQSSGLGEPHVPTNCPRTLQLLPHS